MTKGLAWLPIFYFQSRGIIFCGRVVWACGREGGEGRMGRRETMKTPEGTVKNMREIRKFLIVAEGVFIVSKAVFIV
jgi:hypothetical protein